MKMKTAQIHSCRRIASTNIQSWNANTSSNHGLVKQIANVQRIENQRGEHDREVRHTGKRRQSNCGVGRLAGRRGRHPASRTNRGKCQRLSCCPMIRIAGAASAGRDATALRQARGTPLTEPPDWPAPVVCGIARLFSARFPYNYLRAVQHESDAHHRADLQ